MPGTIATHSIFPRGISPDAAPERGIFTGADSSAETRLFDPSESIAENFSTFALPPSIEPESSPDNPQGPRNPSSSETDAGDGRSILNDPSARADFP